MLNLKSSIKGKWSIFERTYYTVQLTQFCCFLDLFGRTFLVDDHVLSKPLLIPNVSSVLRYGILSSKAEDHFLNEWVHFTYFTKGITKNIIRITHTYTQHKVNCTIKTTIIITTILSLVYYV